jgi:ligand-binding sensor domain-containing protein
MKKYFHLFTLVFTVLTLRANSQEDFFKPFSIEEDNPGLKINKLFRDHSGYIWLGTSDGLFQFNGIQFTRIGLPSAAASIVTAIGQDSLNTIWVGLHSGRIFSIRNLVATAFMPEEGLPKKLITDFVADGRNQLWFATGDEGLYYRANNKIYNISTADGLSDNYVYCLAKTSDDNLLVGTDGGISFINMKDPKKGITHFASADGLPDNIVRVITASSDPSRYWIGTQDKGPVLLDIRERKLLSSPTKNVWPYGQVNDLVQVGKELWIATEENGLVRMSIQPDGSLLIASQLPQWPKISSLAKDAEGNIWLGSKGDLIKSNAGAWSFFRNYKNVSIRKVHCLLSDAANGLWFTPDQGLARMEFNSSHPLSIRQFQVTDPQKHTDITALYQDRFGKIWIGTMGEGAFRLDPETGKWRNIIENDVIRNGHILSITGKGNDIWISGLNGTTHCFLTEANNPVGSKLEFKNFSDSSGIGSSYVYDIFIDSRGRVWFATDGAGLIMMEQGGTHRFSEKEGLKSNVIYSVTEDSFGNIWLASWNQGLYRFDGHQFSNYSAAEGLSDPSVTACTTTPDGKLIAVTKKGIDVLDIRTGKFTNYGRESGILPIQSNLNAIAIDSNHNVWIGTDAGIIEYKSREENNLAGPAMLLDKVSLFLNAIDTGATHAFEHSQNNFTFAFTGLYFTGPEKVKYQYLLEGYNKEWTQTNDQKINFPELPPGTYRFRVRSSANNNFQDGAEANFGFKILSPFWVKWWFIAGIILAVLLLLFLFVRARDKRLRRLASLQKEKIEFEFETLKSQVNPHFLFNSFNTLIDVIEEDPKLAVEYVEQLSAFYRNMLSYRGRDLIKLQEELKLFETYLFLQQKRFGTSLRFRIQVTDSKYLNAFLPPLTLQLLGENALKHNAISKETPLELNIIAEEGKLIIRNNINPKLRPERGEGIGLQNIVNRYKLLTNQEVKYHVVDNEFVVVLPLLKEQ